MACTTMCFKVPLKPTQSLKIKRRGTLAGAPSSFLITPYTIHPTQKSKKPMGIYTPNTMDGEILSF